MGPGGMPVALLLLAAAAATQPARQREGTRCMAALEGADIAARVVYLLRNHLCLSMLLQPRCGVLVPDSTALTANKWGATFGPRLVCPAPFDWCDGVDYSCQGLLGLLILWYKRCYLPESLAHCEREDSALSL